MKEKVMINRNKRGRWLRRIAAASMVGTIGTVSIAQTITQNYFGRATVPQADITASGGPSAWGTDEFYKTGGVREVNNLDSTTYYRNRYSMSNWNYWRTQPAGGHPQFVAHRGWVEAGAGMAENTVDAAVLAAYQGSGLIEIDIRLSKDNVLMALHDADLHRVLKDSRLVSNVNSSEMIGKVSKIKTPSTEGYVWAISTAKWCAGGNKINTVADTMNAVRFGGTSISIWSLCTGYPDTTFVLDSKGPKETIQAIKQFKDSENVILKVYPKYYTNGSGWNCGTDSTKVAKCIFDAAGLSTTSTYKIKIMPVLDDAPNMIDSGQIDQTVTYGNNTAKDWLAYFDVQSVEIPGAWSNNWVTAAGRIKRDMASFSRPRNTEIPVVSVGYRFSDFLVGGTYPLFQTADAFNWDNNGNPVPDTKPLRRRVVGGQKQYYRALNAATTDPNDVICGRHCLVTTDAPFHEAYFYHNNWSWFDGLRNLPANNPKKP